MTFLSDIIASFAGAIAFIVPFLFVFMLVVFFHELGHFAVGRWCGIHVRVFSIGMGREIFGYTDRFGTRWKCAWIPLGGYVAFLGERDTDPVWLSGKPEGMSSRFFERNVFERIAVLAAGPIANFILAIIIFTGIFWIVGVREVSPVVSEVRQESAAEQAGIKVGDTLRSVNGSEIRNFSHVERIVSIHAGEAITLEVERDGQLIALTAIPEEVTRRDSFGGEYRVGVLGISMIASEDGVSVRQSLPFAFGEGVRQTGEITWITLRYLGRMVSGRESADQLGGPIRIAQYSAESASRGIGELLALTAILSISLGILNLLPIPMLDGGHILYHICEVLRGRPLPVSVQAYGLWVGAVFLIAIMSFVTFNDILRLF